jgi:hypothetical protein
VATATSVHKVGIGAKMTRGKGHKQRYPGGTF